MSTLEERLKSPQPPRTPRAAGGRPVERRYELDWLRALVVLGLIPFHAIGMFTGIVNEFLKTTPSSPVLELTADFFGAWPMPLLFAVAGAGAWFALGRRMPSTYAWERISRLAIPFAFGTLVLIPIQVYVIVRTYPQVLDLGIAPISNPHALDSFPQFYLEYLKGYGYFLTHYSKMREIAFWGHLWFIPRLLLYALVTIPLFLWLRGGAGRRLVLRLGGFFERPGALFLLGVPLGILVFASMATSRLEGPAPLSLGWDSYNFWEQLIFNLLCFVYGYFIYSDHRLVRAVGRDGPVALSLGLCCLILSQIPAIVSISPSDEALAIALVALLRAGSVWLFVVGCLGLSVRALRFTNRALRYLNQAAFPLYVLHMPVLVVFGLTVLTWRIPLLAQLLVIVAGTLVLVIGLYELVVRRIGVLRWLFGMKEKEMEKRRTDGGASSSGQVTTV